MPGKRSIERNIGLTLGSRFLGSDDNDTICSTSTIDRSCCSIFQYGNTLYIIHIQVRNLLCNITGPIASQLGFLYRKSINDIERRGRGVHRGNTTNHTIIISSHFTCQHRRKTAQSLIFQIIGSNLGKSTCSTFFRDGLVTRNYHFSEHGFILRHHNLHILLTCYLYLLIIHTNIRNRNLVASSWNIKFKISIYICHSSKRTTRHHNRSTNHRLPILIGNST